MGSPVKDSSFIAAYKQICEDLRIKVDSIRTESDEYEDGSCYYKASGKNETYGFNFWYSLEREESGNSKDEIRASLTIDHSPGTTPFHFSEELDNLYKEGGSLPQWAAWAVHNFNIQYNPLNLELKFHGMSIRVYGLPHYSDPTRDEAAIFLQGLQNAHEGELLVYRMRHIREGDRYRSFSYAFLVNGGYFPFWVFFPQCGALDSGAARRDLKLFEDLISELGKKTVVKREYYDVDYTILEKFLFEVEERFAGTVEDESKDLYELITPAEYAFGKDFTDSFAKFESHYKSRNYLEAMRGLRVLVQRALIIVYKKKRVNISDIKDKDRNIINLSGVLIGKKVLDQKLANWFQAFSNIANLSAHDDYPSGKDIQNYYVKNRTMMTFLLGTQLISEIQAIILLKNDRRKNPWYG